ncbi:MAG: hypothetical protein QXX95_01235 [Nitrososphaerales archaeon]
MAAHIAHEDHFEDVLTHCTYCGIAILAYSKDTVWKNGLPYHKECAERLEI